MARRAKMRNDFFDPDTGRERQPRQVHAHGLTVDLDRAGREPGKSRFALAVYSDAAGYRTVGKDAAHPGRAFEATNSFPKTNARACSELSSSAAAIPPDPKRLAIKTDA